VRKTYFAFYLWVLIHKRGAYQNTTMTMKIKEGYKQTEVGVIPEDWDYKSFSEFSTTVRGGSPRPAGSPKFFNGDFIPWLTVASLTNVPPSQLYICETDSFLTKAGSFYSRILEEDTLIIANSGATLGVAKLLSVRCCANDGIAAMIEIKRNIDKIFVVHFINSITKKLREVIATGNGQPNLNTDLIGAIKVPLPPTKSEQTAIATALSDADALIGSLEKLIEKKRAIKQGAMQELLKPKEGWVVKKFKDKDITELITCGIAATPIYVDESNGFPFLSSTNVKDGKIVWNNFKHIGKELHSLLYKNNPPQKGDILYSRVGTIGEATIVEVDFEFSIYVSLTLIKTGKLLHNEFLKHLLNSHKYKALAQREVLMGGGVGNLNVNVVREYDIPIPLLYEQEEISTILKEMTNEISGLEQKLAKYKMLKQGMMQELLTGKIRLV
jgi:type I restriction enzyme S subunit